MIRLDQTRVGWNVLESRIESRKEVERIIHRWIEDAGNDLWQLKVKRWSQKANNREEWAFDIKEAKVLIEL
jgi:hypothetical protein